MIRRASQDDAAGLASLLRSLTDELPRFAAESAEVTEARVAQVLSHLAADYTLLVAEADGLIVGFVHTHWQPSVLHSGGEGFTAALFIHARYRGQGFGRALLQEIREEAERRGCSRLALLNMRYRPSYERGFYAKLGWKERSYAANFILELKGHVK